MQVDTKDIAALLEMQELDLKINKVAKSLSSLPGRTVILALRTKKKAIEEKRLQLEDIHRQSDKKLSSIEDEDAKLAARQRAIQDEIEQVKVDYRSVEARAKELNGLAKRRSALVAELATLGDEVAKIEAMQFQVRNALDTLTVQETNETKIFVAQGGRLKQDLAHYTSLRLRCAETIEPKLLELYEGIAREREGVALARLSGLTCGACRMNIEQGHLIDMKTQGNIASCPRCGRLLILE